LLNAHKHISLYDYQMITKYMIAIAAMAVMLIGATALATEDAFAKKRSNSQAASQVDDCGNGDSPIDVFCQNLNSQIQGDENAAALSGEQS
jgi:hypothetical protein